MTFTSRRQSTQERQLKERERIAASVMPALKDLFKPELLNRIDEIVLFHMLEPEHLREIVDLMVAQTQQRMQEQGIELQVSDVARNLLVQHGYDPVYGARPLRRTVQRMLEDMLAEAILQGAFVADDTVMVDVVEDRLVAKTLVAVHKGEVREIGSGQQEAA